MTTNIRRITALLLGLTLGGSAVSAPTPSGCRALREACRAAGYGDSGKHLGKDCLKPLLDGATVDKVTVNAGDIEACKSKKAKKTAPAPSGESSTPTTTPAPGTQPATPPADDDGDSAS